MMRAMAEKAKRRGRGQPTKLNKEISDKICSAIRAGNYMETAAMYAGISKSTLHKWLQDGARATSGPFHEFSVAVQKALAASEVEDVARIKQAGNRTWQAIAWRLERRFPDRWGRRQQLDANISAQVTAYGPYRDIDAEIREYLEQAIKQGKIPSWLAAASQEKSDSSARKLEGVADPGRPILGQDPVGR